MMDIDSGMLDASQEIFLLDLVSKEEDIIAKIFTYLGLDDRLNLASTCKLLNDLHNSRPELCGQIWLNSNSAASSEFPLSRKYSKIKLLNFDLNSTDHPSPAELLKPHATVMTGLQVRHIAKNENEDDDMDDSVERIENPEKLLELIPFFSHLTYLDLLSGRQFDFFYPMPEFAPNVQPAAEIITMPNLQYLTICYELFASLHRDYIDFSKCRRLVSLDIETQAFSLAYDVRDDRQQAMFELMPKLIQQQQNLKSLKIDFHHCAHLFNRQLSLAPGAKPLYKFKFTDYAHNSATAVQQMNLLDFMESHVQEGKSKFDIRGDGLNPAKVEPQLCQFIAKNLDMPYETQGIVCERAGRVSNIPKESKKYNTFTRAELRRIFRSPIKPNPATINFNLFLSSDGNRRVRDFMVSSVSLKYQNLQHLAVSWSRLPPNLAPLNTLAHLKSLKLQSYGQDFNSCLRNVSIPGLEKFKFDTHTSDLKHRHCVQILKFIDRHSKLTSFNIGMWPGIWVERNQHVTKKFFDDCFYLLNYAMKNLRELDMLIYRSSHDLKQKVPDRFRATTHLLLEVYTKTGFALKFVKHGDYEMTFTKIADGVDEKISINPHRF